MCADCFPAYVLAAAVPTWIWATLVMIAFAALSAFTVWLVGVAVRRAPPQAAPPKRADDDTSAP